MTRIITYTISEDFDGYTILQYLKSKNYTHNVIVQLKKTTNGILRNNHWAYVTETLATSDILQIQLFEKEQSSSSILPVFHPLDIMYEDEDLMVINKASNMPIHPSMGNHENTLANAITWHFKEKGEIFTFRCINRLDRDTTGLTIIAKNSLSAGILNQQVASRMIHRTYLAICIGHVPPAGTINAPIGRVNHSTIERCIDYKNGESAITHYQTLQYNSDTNLSLIKLQLETGRTHQIRVHMKSIGYPLIGDFLYYPDDTYIKRQALHSYSLEFFHPITGKPLFFQSELPIDMKFLFQEI